jgi:hypothetical protein
MEEEAKQEQKPKKKKTTSKKTDKKQTNKPVKEQKNNSNEMEATVEEKKEKTSENYHLGKEEQKRLKLASKFIYVMAKIFQVLMIIGIVGIFIAMIVIPIFTVNIKAEVREGVASVKIFDKKLNYVRNSEKITIYEAEDVENKVEITDKKDIESLNRVFDYLEENDLSKLTVYTEIVLILSVVSLFIIYLIMQKLNILFKNINRDYSPFMLENVDILKSMTKLLLCALVVSYVIEIVVSLAVDYNISTNINLTNIIAIVIVYAMSLIFEYGNKLQNATKGKIYSEYD